MSEEKKNPPRAQIFRYFRIESRNNKIYFYPKNSSAGQYFSQVLFILELGASGESKQPTKMALSGSSGDKIRLPETPSFETKLDNVLSKTKLDLSTKSWIQSNFYSCDSTDDFIEQIKTLEKKNLRILFNQFDSERGALLKNLKDIGIERSQVESSNLMFHWFKGHESFETFLKTDEAKSWFSKHEIDNISVKVRNLTNKCDTTEKSLNILRKNLKERLKK